MTMHELIATPLSDSTVFVVYHNGQMIAPPFHKSAPPAELPAAAITMYRPILLTISDPALLVYLEDA